MVWNACSKARLWHNAPVHSASSFIVIFIDDALAQDAAAGAMSGTSMFVMIGIFFLIMYFMIIRPQNKRVKEHRALVDALQKGDEVSVSGGLMGRITHIGQTSVRLEIADGVEVRVRKDSVNNVLPKGSLAKSD